MDDQAGQDSELPAGFKYMECKHCGKPMKVGNKRRNAPSHVECGVTVAMTVQRQMAAKSGPYYDRWLASQQRAIDNARGGGTPNVDKG